MNKTVQLRHGYYEFVAPFRISGFHIVDANDRTVTVAKTFEIAEVLVDLLNKTYG